MENAFSPSVIQDRNILLLNSPSVMILVNASVEKGTVKHNYYCSYPKDWSRSKMCLRRDSETLCP